MRFLQLTVTLAMALLAASPVLASQGGGGSGIRLTTLGPGTHADVAHAANGGFWVAWQRGRELLGRRFDDIGRPLGPARRLVPMTHAAGGAPRITPTPDGGFLLAWADADGGGSGAFARRFDRHGVPRGPRLRLNESIDGEQTSPRLALADGGGFLAVWSESRAGGDAGSGGGGAIEARGFDPTGRPRGADQLVVEATHPRPELAEVAAITGERYVVAWGTSNADPFGPSPGPAAGRLIGGDGRSLDGAFPVGLDDLPTSAVHAVLAQSDGTVQILVVVSSHLAALRHSASGALVDEPHFLGPGEAAVQLVDGYWVAGGGAVQIPGGGGRQIDLHRVAGDGTQAVPAPIYRFACGFVTPFRCIPDGVAYVPPRLAATSGGALLVWQDPTAGLTAGFVPAGWDSIVSTKSPIHRTAEGLVETILVEREGPATSPATVGYRTIDRTARAGRDYQPVSGQVDFAAGDRGPREVRIPILADTRHEADEDFFLELTASPPTVLVAEPSRTRVTITEDRCVPSTTALCLLGGRLRIEAGEGYPDAELRPATAVPLTDLSGAFLFADGEPTLAVKALDFGDELRVYFGRTVVTPFRAIVTDTLELTRGEWFWSGVEPECYGSYPLSLPKSGNVLAAADEPTVRELAGSTVPCAGPPASLCFGAGRYEVTARWTNDLDGTSGVASARALTPATGVMSFTDPAALELLIRARRATSTNLGTVVVGALGNLPYVVTARDTVTGETREYENRAGSFCGFAVTPFF